MLIVQISLFIVTFLSLISQILSLMQASKEVNPHFRIAPCVNIWSVTFFFFVFFFLCHLFNVGACICHIAGETKCSGPHHTIQTLHFVLFQSVTCYINYIVSRIHVKTTQLCNITCALLATSVILRSLECTKSNVTSFVKINKKGSHVTSSTAAYIYL